MPSAARSSHSTHVAAVGHGAEHPSQRVALFRRGSTTSVSRIAETGVELDDLDALGRLHQTAVEHARERAPSATIASAVRCMTLTQGIGLVLQRDERQRRVGAHAARVGSFVPVERTFVVLGQRHGHHPAARDEA